MFFCQSCAAVLRLVWIRVWRIAALTCENGVGFAGVGGLIGPVASMMCQPNLEWTGWEIWPVLSLKATSDLAGLELEGHVLELLHVLDRHGFGQGGRRARR